MITEVPVLDENHSGFIFDEEKNLDEIIRRMTLVDIEPFNGNIM